MVGSGGLEVFKYGREGYQARELEAACNVPHTRALSLSPSLSLSLFHTHTHTRARALSHSLTHTLTHARSLSLSHTHTHETDKDLVAFAVGQVQTLISLGKDLI